MLRSRIIKRREALQPEAHAPRDNTRDSDDLMNKRSPLYFLKRHKIEYFPYAIGAQKTREQDACLRKIHLLMNGGLFRRNLKIAPFLCVQNRCKDTWGIEVGHA